jgi:hypothetical protein
MSKYQDDIRTTNIPVFTTLLLQISDAKPSTPIKNIAESNMKIKFNKEGRHSMDTTPANPETQDHRQGAQQDTKQKHESAK